MSGCDDDITLDMHIEIQDEEDSSDSEDDGELEN